MFCVIYQWRVKPGMEETFRQTWREITEAIYTQRGALGSRLHQSDTDERVWIAYAQWPDREHWESVDKISGVEAASQRQRECLLEEIKVLFTVTVTDDLLKAAPFASL